MSDKTQKTITDFTIEHAKKRPVSFHMPGHKGRFRTFDKYGFKDFAESLINQDITEIRGADVLGSPSSVIMNVMENYRDLYEVKHTELLINGSSVGIMAAILASVERGGSIIIDRQSHKSVYNALRLGRIKPIYAKTSEKSIREALVKSNDASAVLITSPDYMGNMVNIRRIANDVHALGKILIVDQAHGAHLKFFDNAFKTRTAAENSGADIVVESTHKTLFSFTGTGILNICTERIDKRAIREMLNMLETTSPSYILMDSLDINEKIMHQYGDEIVRSWRRNILNFYKKASDINGIRFNSNVDISGRNFQTDIDITKIRIDMSAIGLSGEDLQSRLEDYGIYVEMSYGNEVLIYTGAGNTEDDFEELYKALKQISNSWKQPDNSKSERFISLDENPEDIYCTEQADIPDEYENVSIRYAEGRILYDPIIPFPPGRAIACPGEIVNRNLIMAIMKMMMDEKTVFGVDDDGEIKVGIVKGK